MLGDRIKFGQDLLHDHRRIGIGAWIIDRHRIHCVDELVLVRCQTSAQRGGCTQR